jgi:hypothetical protein
MKSVAQNRWLWILCLVALMLPAISLAEPASEERCAYVNLNVNIEGCPFERGWVLYNKCTDRAVSATVRVTMTKGTKKDSWIKVYSLAPGEKIFLFCRKYDGSAGGFPTYYKAALVGETKN